MHNPLLTIAIPTYNRAHFLALTVRRIAEELRTVEPDIIEWIVSDNASTDGTQALLQSVKASGQPIKIIRNVWNIGADANTAQCFDEARGRYVLILGDDDLPVEGALSRIIRLLQSGDYGMICLRPYGYDADYRREHPGGHPNEQAYRNPGDFLVACGARITFISACIINKSLLHDLKARHLTGGHLVQTQLVFRAALRAKANLMVADYLIACKRNNSGGYDFTSVFVTELGDILDRAVLLGLSSADKARLEQRLILSFYPLAIFKERQKHPKPLYATQIRFAERFQHSWRYRLLLQPILLWPQPLALLYGALVVAIGRIAIGDFRRGLAFLVHRFNHIRN